MNGAKTGERQLLKPVPHPFRQWPEVLTVNSTFFGSLSSLCAAAYT